MNDKPRTDKHEQARNALPDDLKPIFDELVEDYKFASVTQLGRAYVSYSILAEIVRVGWRHVADSTPLDRESK